MPKIYGKEWGAYPTDEELGIQTSMDDCENCYYTYLCTDKCKQQVSTEESSKEIVSEILGGIMEIVDEFIENEDKCYDYYTNTYGVVPEERRDEDGNLIGLVYKSNSDETRRLWGDSLTVIMDGESDDEYSDGEAIDDINERQYYFH